MSDDELDIVVGNICREENIPLAQKVKSLFHVISISAASSADQHGDSTDHRYTDVPHHVHSCYKELLSWLLQSGHLPHVLYMELVNRDPLSSQFPPAFPQQPMIPPNVPVPFNAYPAMAPYRYPPMAFQQPTTIPQYPVGPNTTTAMPPFQPAPNQHGASPLSLSTLLPNNDRTSPSSALSPNSDWQSSPSLSNIDFSPFGSMDHDAGMARRPPRASLNNGEPTVKEGLPAPNQHGAASSLSPNNDRTSSSPTLPPNNDWQSSPSHHAGIMAPRPPCPSLNNGDQTVQDGLDEFVGTMQTTSQCSFQHIDSTIRLLTTSMTSHGWECGDCQYWEAPIGGSAEAFTSTHGASWIADKIPSFCSYYMIRKCLMNETEKRRMYTVLSELTDFLFQQLYITAERKGKIKRYIAKCRSIDGEAIVAALAMLNRNGYWKSLERAAANPNEGANAMMNDKDDAVNEERVTSEVPMVVKEVTEDTWIFKRPSQFMYGGNDSSGEAANDDDSGSNAGIPLRLPRDFARLGTRGMGISCMGLQCRKGVWSPFSQYGDPYYVCVNVYPPPYED